MIPLVAAETLIRFSRALATTTEPREILRQLAEASVQVLGADGAVVLQVDGEGMKVVASEGVPDAASLHVEADSIGRELDAALLEATGGRFARAQTLPLVSDGGLFGVLVLLFDVESGLDSVNTRLAGGLADLAAASIAKAVQYQSLSEAYRQLQAAKEALARADKLRALGEMAAGVSHDLKNLLTPVQMQIGLLEGAKPGDQKRIDVVVEILKRTLTRGLDTVERLRAFSRQMPEERRAAVTDIRPLVDEAVALGRTRAKEHGLELSVEHGAAPPVLIEASELVTSLMNLIVNGLDAVQPRGHGHVVVRSYAADDGACVDVADDGPGIAAEVQQRLFEPFFTTKGEKGTGLGLAMVYAFVQRQGGRISVTSPETGGAVVKLWFPRAP